MEIQPISFDIPGIMACQQNRYPMLFIDRVTECVPLKYAKGFKLFTYNEWYFHGYETASPKVWNVVQIEAMSQMFLMTFLSEEKFRGLVAMSNRFDKVQFFRKIIPGERLDLEATLESFGRGVARGKVKGEVNGVLTCSMECTIVIPEFFADFKQSLANNTASKVVSNITAGNVINFGIENVKECLLNKYPWLLLDGATEIQPGKFVKAIKNFTYNEHYFPAHFPGSPSVPGFIQIECCMQSFLLTFLSLDQYKRRETADRLLNNVHLRRKIVPGDTLEMHASLDSFSRGIARGRVESYVNGEQAISLEVTAVVVDELEKFRPKLKG
ncbi:3-hydroxyacyl-ACP dehydratase FabZ family protein [Polynucleobacter asymbioticus]|uniref:3-hydroxyacyl-ACP dehydratase FabZ family protein n=1 Tax=Polynucleobacter asymbioticus TaxID=576611 RepID=UPI001BFE5E25|nr:3-hydroxyacyl-ACP dehydratase FabZ family protein [Polynucleobacter asymbioticus]